MDKKTETQERINLLKDFPSTTIEDWKEQVRKDLNGEDFDKKLVWKTDEGFVVEPFYTYEDLKGFSYLTDSVPGEYPFVRGNNGVENEWDICEEITGENINDSNKLAKDAVLNGADSLTFTGLSLNTKEDISELLKDIPIGEKKLNFDIDFDSLQIIDLLSAQTKLSGALYLSPLNDLLINGQLPGKDDDCFKIISEFISGAASQIPDYKTLA
ncbi:MAG: methylmalonyl-CoA mutase family protein, partial [Thermodesulfobacteriota bacterium]